MRSLALTSLSVLVAIGSCVPGAFASISTIVTYQGLLKDSGGAPINAPSDLAFTIYADSLTGSTLWSESHPATPVVGGVFTVRLGESTPFPAALFANPKLWLQTSVSGTALVPRVLLGASAYAFRAAIADSIAGGGSSDLWSASGSDVYRASGRVGVGTNAPTTTLDVNGVVRSRSGGFTFPDGTTLTSANLASGVTLDQAYNKGGAGAGRTITANSGAVNIAGSSGLTVNGNVGIGTASPGYKLSVAGVIQSTTGGIRFPDGTIQTTAALPHTFVACINFSGTACTTIYCGCGTASLITQIQSDCTVTSDTGSCSAKSFSCMSGGIGHGTCCVCQP